MKASCISAGLILLLGACKKDAQVPLPPDQPYVLDLPVGFPEPKIPEDNQLTVYRVELGKNLFFDPAISRDGTVSCGSCHLPEKAFTDGLSKAVGIDERVGIRNAIHLTNVAYHKTLLWDGGVPSLEAQILAPIADTNEFDTELSAAVGRFAENDDYQRLSQAAYDRPFDAFVLTRAIAAFERTLISTEAPIDRYVYNNDTAALSESQVRGMNIFFSSFVNCGACHTGVNFTNGSFQNNGLYSFYKDPGREGITGNPADNAKFKVPSLRNVEYTAPYMHDGSKQTLEEVVEHYNSGGKFHPSKSHLVRKLNLTQQQKDDIVNFLKALTDHNFLENPEFRP